VVSDPDGLHLDLYAQLPEDALRPPA